MHQRFLIALLVLGLVVLALGGWLVAFFGRPARPRIA
jgi:hypothetical protein